MAPPSTKHIEIDWTTPSSSSFVRLGEQPLSQENPDFTNIVPRVLITTKDILSLDIDDILDYREFDLDYDEYCDAYYEDHIQPLLSQKEVTTDLLTLHTDVETPEKVTTPEENIPSMVAPPEDNTPSTVTLIKEDTPSLAHHTDDDKIIVTTNKNILHIDTPTANNPPSTQKNTFSTNPSTKRQQEKRFERNCRRVCNNAGINYATASREELHLASLRKSFLMLKSDLVLKPLTHLRYRTKFAHPSQEDYDFAIPTLTAPFAFEPKEETPQPVPSAFEPNEETPQPVPFAFEPKEDKPQPPVPAPSIDLSRIPDDLVEYIPDHPVYENDFYNLLTDKQKLKRKPLHPGSKAWIQHIRTLKSLKELDLKVKRHELESREMAKLWNTSFDMIDRRLSLAIELTTLQDLQSKKAKIGHEILMIPLTSKTKKRKVEKLIDKIDRLSPQIEEILTNTSSLRMVPYYITEEELALELRPNKRTVDINRNLDTLLSLHPIKRVRTNDSSESRIDTASTLSG
ncbi:hypothetical protein C1646_760318 [Rhizophagus diaphanus]|nr:hypothetical protein C1646_760318 [Rhizophagus diaphanus] [Rhizophagus sp. MUCL 43196]